MITITPLVVGTCRQPRRLLDRRAGVHGLWDVVTLPALAVLLDHPVHGPVLFDTGWSTSMRLRVPQLPHAIYRRLIGYRIAEERDVERQLASLGVAAHEVRHVIVSHLHADHVAGLDAFPRATVHLSAAAWTHARSVKGLSAWRHGTFPELLPSDLASRVRTVDGFGGPEVGALGGTVDLFGDGTILLVDLPGHAPGQIGAWIASRDGSTLLAADALFTPSQLDLLRPASRVVERFVAHDPGTYLATLRRLRSTVDRVPHLDVVAAHDPRFLDLDPLRSSDRRETPA